MRYQRYQWRMSDDEPVFNEPVFNEPIVMPAPPFPPFPSGPHRDVVFFRSAEPETGGREHEDIMLRRVPRETAMHFRAAAGGRSMTHAQYLAALVGLHRRIRELADAGDEAMRRELETLGLASVTV